MTVSGSSTILAMLGLVVLICLSAFFSSSETAIFSLPEEWIDEQAAEGNDSSRILDSLRDDPHRLLVTLLVGNNVVNVAIATITTVLVTEYLSGGVAATVATVLASFFILIFGEIVPKSYGLGRAKQWSLTVARPISVAETALSPLVVVFDVVTRWINARIGGDEAIEPSYTDE